MLSLSGILVAEGLRMKINCVWNEAMQFTAQSEGHSVLMDAKRPIGAGTALTPKELVLAGLCGCTAMDVAGLMRKYRQQMDQFEVFAEATVTEGGHPIVFKQVSLLFSVVGNVEVSKLIEAVDLSQTKYCGVSAMIAKSAPIHYRIVLNEKEIHTGDSRFS